MSATNSSSEEDYIVEQWKIKKLIKDLSNARGNGTSMISLIIPPKDQISRVSKLLNEEYGTASNIKSRVNRLSVLSAITSTIQRLKLYSNVPDNGLVIYCGTVVNEDNKERKVNIDFEPFKPINTSLYLCDNKFHTEAMNELLEENKTFGFIVMDGSGCLFGTLCGNTQSVLHKFSVELPKKHGRGGQSSVRFARLRVEKRNNYIRKVAENAGKLFISNDNLLVSGLVLAGSASFKNELAASEILDYRLKPLIVKLVDVSYGGENGFNQAIELSAEALQDVKFVTEKKILSNFMNEIALDTGKICYGLKSTIKALEMNAVENLIIWDNLDIKRYEVRSVNANTGEEEIKIMYQRPEQTNKDSLFKDETSGATLDVIDSMSLLEWLADHYKDYSTKMTFITDCSQEGAQFCKGFGGIGGFLRYQLNFEHLETESEDSVSLSYDIFRKFI